MTTINTQSLVTKLKRLVKSESGNASIESLFWIPIFVFILVLIVDASFVFHGKTQALKIIQDNNRAYSVGRLTTPAELEQAVAAEIARLSPNATISSSLTSGIATTTVSFPAIDMMSVGSIEALQRITISVVSKQYVES
jgi:Flp pilus assembly protein TadG